VQPTDNFSIVLNTS